jgi:hypothetical protein
VSLAKFDHLVAEWHADNSRAPCQIWKWADLIAKWACATCQHEWTDTVKNRVRGVGCPQCKARVKRARQDRINANYIPRSPRAMTCKWCDCAILRRGRGPKQYCSTQCALAAKASKATVAHQERKESLPKCATTDCKAKIWHAGQQYCKVCQERIRRTGTADKWLPCTRCGERYNKTKSRKGTLCTKCKNKAQITSSLERQCEACGKVFVRARRSNDAARACSRECGFKIIAADRMAKFASARLSAFVARRNAAASKLVGSLKPCCVCGKHFAAKGRASACSAGCRREQSRIEAIASRYGSYELWLTKRCADCNGLVEKTGKHRRYKGQYCIKCSKVRKRALKSAAHFNRRRLQNGVTSDSPTKAILKGIAEMIRKAGNRCPLCGLMMTKGCSPNNDRHIELDHKIPLSRGGTDTFDNLQAICRKCNGLKSASHSVDVVLKPANV